MVPPINMVHEINDRKNNKIETHRRWMNDMEEEIDRIEKISYMKINNHYNSQIAYTIKQGYTCIVYIGAIAMPTETESRYSNI